MRTFFVPFFAPFVPFFMSFAQEGPFVEEEVTIPRAGVLSDSVPSGRAGVAHIPVARECGRWDDEQSG